MLDQPDHAPGVAERPPEEQAGNKQTEHDEQGRRTRWPLILLAVVVVLGAAGGLAFWLLTRDQQTTDDAYTDGRAIVVAPHVAGYVKTLAVNDNQFVHKGDLLLQIEPQDYLAIRDQAAGQLKALQAQLESARVAYEKAQVVYPAQKAQAEGQLEQAKAQLFQSERENSRQTAMNDIATTQANRDSAKSSFQSAGAQVVQAEAQLKQAQLVPQNVAQAAAAVRQLEGQVEQAKGQVEQAEINLGYTHIVAAQDGWVTKRNVEIGSYLQPGQQVMALVLPEVWVTANYKETQLERLRPGQHVKVRIDAYPQLRLDGHVDSVQLGSGSRFTAFPPENATGNFVKIVQRVPVKIVIDGGLSPEIPLPLGISVEPTVMLK